MRKVYLFSFLLIVGLVLSQLIPPALGPSNFEVFKTFSDAFLYISLAFIMINVGREFEIDKTRWKTYTMDYLIAMGAAGLPWVLVALYYIFIVPPTDMALWSSGEAWKETFLLSRFAAPTSAGILFTMLAAANLKNTWVYRKVQVLAIFDDLDTILFMIPLQMLMIGMKWQMFVIVIVAVVLIWFGWTRMNKYKMSQNWKYILLYSVILFIVFHGIYVITKGAYGKEGAIHIEILLPAFVLGVVMRTEHVVEPHHVDEKVASGISYFFMLLVGMSMPQFIGVDFMAAAEGSNTIISQIPMMPWGTIAVHVVIVTIISNIGKLFPLFFYRNRKVAERLAVAVGMFTRGEVGAGVLFIAISYHLSGVLLVISVLVMCLNLLLTGLFIGFAKRLIAASEESPGVVTGWKK